MSNPSESQNNSASPNATRPQASGDDSAEKRALLAWVKMAVEDQAAVFAGRERQLLETMQTEVSRVRGNAIQTAERLQTRERSLSQQTEKLTALIGETMVKSVTLIQKGRDLDAQAALARTAADLEVERIRGELHLQNAENERRIEHFKAEADARHDAFRNESEQRVRALQIENAALEAALDQARKELIAASNAVANGQAALNQAFDERNTLSSLNKMLYGDVRACLDAMGSLSNELQRMRLSWVWKLRTRIRELRASDNFLPAPPKLSMAYHNYNSTEFPGSVTSSAGVAQEALGRQASEAINNANIKHLDELLGLDDAEFIEALYLTLLKREPDEPGRIHTLAALRGGVDKLTLVINTAQSIEGRRYKAVLRGLNEAVLWHQRERRWPLGPFYRLLHVFKRMYRQINRLESRLAQIESNVQDIHALYNDGKGSSVISQYDTENFLAERADGAISEAIKVPVGTPRSVATIFTKLKTQTIRNQKRKS